MILHKEYETNKYLKTIYGNFNFLHREKVFSLAIESGRHSIKDIYIYI